MTASRTETQLPPAKCRRWQLLRAGIQNLWEYDDQRFVFTHGRLLLRGQNESGKTKALEVLLPFLLDASLQPGRLDPFGSSARLMQWNLINDANKDVTINVGYVWLEFGRRNDDGKSETCTIGAGLKARRSSPGVEAWYFHTPQRIDQDLALWDKERRPHARPALEALIDAGGGRVCESAHEYRRAVNERLFQMPADQYGTLIDALLQLRRPQLSKQLDPDALSNVLSASLPPPDAAIVATLAEGFERLDRHRAEREDLSTTLDTIRSFLKTYRTYAAAWSKARALDLTRSESAFHKLSAELRGFEQQRDTVRDVRTKLGQRIGALEREHEELDERIRTLRASEAYQSVAVIDRAAEEAKLLENASIRAEKRAQDEEGDAANRRKQVLKAEDELAVASQTVASTRNVARVCAEDAALANEHASLERLSEGPSPEAMQGALVAVLEQRTRVLRRLNELSQLADRAREAETRAADQLRSADGRLQRAKDTLTAAQRAAEEADTAFLEHLGRWHNSLSVLRIALAALGRSPSEARGVADAAAESARRELETTAGALAIAVGDLEAKLASTAAEQAALEAATHRLPPPPNWRSVRSADRLGAPLYMLCDFVPDLADPKAAACIEAALEASGLLDAWMTPDGRLLDLQTDDAMLLATGPVHGSNLLGVLRAVEGAVPRALTEAILERIALVPAGVDFGETQCGIGEDGRFCLGPLRGVHTKPAAEFIGSANRERERLRKLAELEQQRASLEAAATDLRARQADLQLRREQLAAELLQFPDTRPLLDAIVRVESAATALGVENADFVAARDGLTARAAEFRGAVAARDQYAGENGLRAWSAAAETLKDRTALYRIQAEHLVRDLQVAAQGALVLDERRADAAAAGARASVTRADAAEASTRARVARAHANAIRDSHGSTKEQVLTELGAAEDRLEAGVAEVRRLRQDKQAADEEALGAEVKVNEATTRVSTADDRRRAAESALRALVHRGFLAAAGATTDVDGDPMGWTFTQMLQTARRIDDSTAGADPSEAARENAVNKVSAAQQELSRGLRAEVKVLPEQRDGLLEYQAAWNGRVVSLIELAAELEKDIAARDGLLTEREHELFESFLSGEAHQHLRSRLREVFELVSRMNKKIHEHPSSSGMQLRLVWSVGAEAPAGSREAVGMLLKSGPLLTEQDRDALADFLRDRLTQARAQEESGTLLERLLAVLDYRRWHQFQVEFRTAPENWRLLTKKAHAAGSGGKKAMMLHLPLFAAAAAFYESAAKTSPRLILLDEAFAGIDKESRGQCMGLLADFDLDFMMTSFEEWGFYAQLDGISTYNLSREKGMRGIHSEWFVWNGSHAIQVEGS